MKNEQLQPLRNLLFVQFFGAFNDNAWKLIVTLLGIRAVERLFDTDDPMLQQASQWETTVAFGVLMLPLVLFSLPAALLADRLSKRDLMISMKFVEVLLMLTAAVTLFAAPEVRWLPLLILGMMGAQSALFSPAKYGILPEILSHENLSRGNARLEMWTFLAIVLGTAAGGVLLEISGSFYWSAGAVLFTFALVGFALSFGIPKVPPVRVEGAMRVTIGTAWSAIRTERILKLAVMGSVLYWTIASLLGQDILVYAKSVLHASEISAAFPLAAFGLGVGLGSLWAGRLSAQKVEYGLIPLGAFWLALMTLLVAWIGPDFTGLLALAALMGIGSGLLIVPLNALIQWKSPEGGRGAVIALSNVFVFSGILVGSLGAGLLAQAGLSAREIMSVAVLILFLGTAWSIWLLPDALLRLCLILLTNTVYRLKVIGRYHLPEQTGALLVPNHVSFVDGLMLLASLDRPIRFIVDRDYFERWFLKPFMKALGAIPVSASDRPRVTLRALRQAGELIGAGEIVCVFPEGQITRTGALLPFRRGYQRILKGRTVPIIPVYLDRLWGSIFSHEGGRFLAKIPREIPYHVTVAFGEPLDPETPPIRIREAVQALATHAWDLRKKQARPLHSSVIRRARSRPWALALADGRTPGVSRLKSLIGAVTLARALRKRWAQEKYVGILLPPSVPAALINLASSLAGKISVNLNYTQGRSGMESVVRQTGLRSIVTSSTFLSKANLDIPEGIPLILLEKLAPEISIWTKLLSTFAACVLPVSMLEKACGAAQNVRSSDVVTVIFSSGSTGEPKGVLLTHGNIGSNVEALTQVLRVTSRDRLLGILPLFHSFGYMSFWFAAGKGVAMPTHFNPLEGAVVGDLVHRYRVTILLATPTFLQIYMRGCTPAQFGSLRLVLTGAERLTDRLALAFEDRFGVRALEGYGCTECSPVVAVSVPDFRAPGFFQPGSKRGFVGQPLPGVSVKIVEVEGSEPVPANEPGMLLVKGPNVMRGYLEREDLTRSVLVDGWYVTGDLALVNAEGFLKITDRLSRFSKIGGEMVPHGRIEEVLHEVAGSEQRIFAVTSVIDEKKGEALVVVHTYEDEKVPDLLEGLKQMGLPNLFIPRKDRFLRVEQIPYLGTGKLDLKGLKDLAEESFT